jgi:SAM-dependent methyltransferase
LAPAYSDQDLAVLEAEVLPKYLSFFHAIASDRIGHAPPGKVALMGPLASKLIGAATERLTTTADVHVVSELPIRHPDASFSHVVAVHPLTRPADRRRLLAEALRVLVPRGQLLLALPLRGSYAEVSDMLREFALKSDSTKLAEAVEIAAQSRPNPETLTEELEEAGFDDPSVSVELLSVPFESGRHFAGHPLFSLVVGPEMAATLGLSPETVRPALEYVQSAIGKYWSDGAFELGVNLGCVSARRP